MNRHPSITADRIIAACASDETIGFCRSCGNETTGVEPDANGYKCDNCGDMAVSGAEEFLFEILQSKLCGSIQIL